MKLEKGTIIQTANGVYVVLEEEPYGESFRCVRTAFGIFDDLEFIEIIKKEIKGYQS